MSCFRRLFSCCISSSATSDDYPPDGNEGLIGSFDFSQDTPQTGVKSVQPQIDAINRNMLGPGLCPMARSDLRTLLETNEIELNTSAEAKIGEGMGTVVFRCSRAVYSRREEGATPQRVGSLPAAVKIIRFRPGLEAIEVQQEMWALAFLCHPNLIKSYLLAGPVLEDRIKPPVGRKFDPLACLLVQDYLQGGALTDWQHLHGQEHLPEQLLACWLHQVTAGLEHLHAKKVAHQDLHAGNVMLDLHGKVVLIDLGASKRLEAIQAQFQDTFTSPSHQTGRHDSGVEMTPTKSQPTEADPQQQQVAEERHELEFRNDLVQLGSMLCSLAGRTDSRSVESDSRISANEATLESCAKACLDQNLPTTVRAVLTHRWLTSSVLYRYNHHAFY